MRSKLTDIISTFDQFNWFGWFSDEYKNRAQVDMATYIDELPNTPVVTDVQEVAITELLKRNQDLRKLNERTTYAKEYVKSFDEFINEINQSSYSQTQSYFGCLDDSDDMGEEE